MTDVAALDQMLQEFEDRRLFREPKRVPRGKDAGWAATQGTIEIGERTVELRLELSACFPLCRPEFFLESRDLPMIPHVTSSRLICFADPEGLVLDRHRPIDIIEDALERVKTVLEEGLSDRNLADFGDEFEHYWVNLGGPAICSLIEPIESLQWGEIATHKDEVSFAYLKSNSIDAFLNGKSPSNKQTVHRALYLPLNADTVLLPPRKEQFWTVEQAREELVSNLSPINQQRLKRMLKHRTRQSEYVYVNLPRSNGGSSLFAVKFEGVGKHHPLLEQGTAERVVPLCLQRLDKDYLIGRGGGNILLSQKRVLLAGCGAVGGQIAFDLVRAGVLFLTFVDPDVISSNNTFRHVLGRKHWGQKKVVALKLALEENYPYVQVKAISLPIENAIDDGSVDFSDFDLVILALGNPTVEMAINEQLHNLLDGPPAIYTWLEPYGIGGHALLARNALTGGCFECLYTSPNGSLENRASFAAPKQSFGKALSGCGSLHTPYGAMDAARTAELASRLAVDQLTGKENGNPLLYWRGDTSAFTDAGFRLSQRHDFSDEELNQQRYDYMSDRCRVCHA